jgi:uncharacterized integral membrane protein
VTENPAPTSPEQPAADPSGAPLGGTGEVDATPAPAGAAGAADPSREELLREELRDLDTQTKDPLRGSRTSGLWAGVAGLGVLLVLLIIFIAQNTATTTVTFLAWSGEVSVAVALLIAAVAGLFLAVAAGSLRILQLRRRVRRTKKQQKKARAAR